MKAFCFKTVRRNDKQTLKLNYTKNLKETELEHFFPIFDKACREYFARLLWRDNERRHSNASAYIKAFLASHEFERNWVSTPFFHFLQSKMRIYSEAFRKILALEMRLIRG